MYAFKTIVAAALLALPAFALPQDPTDGPCSGGQVQCCDTSARGDSDHMREVGKALNMNIDPNTMYATGCTPSNGLVGSGSSASCTSKPMCCMNNGSGSSGDDGLMGLIGNLIGVDCGDISVGL
ncbi:hypothetical protein OBBRIDRAFT_805672 [Obba rivulosa]|uniref:Hydrophobin n=1 Tax=Obba rivulosa TaxID=1052685 RepID=A0A8E2ANJ4_9APHY|nr:hypothetical protein OBBRIDRAFT_805672 [Obba rivulosa]